MRKGMALYGAFSVFLLLGEAAYAADWYSGRGGSARPPSQVWTAPPSALNWGGFYAGINLGGAWGSNDKAALAAAPILDSDYAVLATSLADAKVDYGIGKFVAGQQLGYNWQATNNVVVGVETDLQASFEDRKAKFIESNASGYALFYNWNTRRIIPTTFDMASRTSFEKNIDYFGTLRARFGYLATPSFLIYGTIGLAYGQTRFRSSVAQVTGFTDLYGNTIYMAGVGGDNISRIRVGWTIGAGFEWMFAQNWSAKFEYLYYDLGTARVAYNLYDIGSGGLAYATTNAKTRFNGNILRAGLNYHMNWLSPSTLASRY